MTPQSDQPLAALAKFACYLLARVEALETLLIQKEIVSKEELRDVNEKAQKGIAPHLRGLDHRDVKDFEPVLTKTLELLKARLAERPR
jgi:hypothetical protein